MYKKNKSEVIKKQTPGLISHILLQKSEVDESNLLLTWVEIEPGFNQPLHQHQAEQAYIIIQGNGEITVDKEKEAVTKGDIIYIPSNELHGILNTGGTLLVYISASTPSFDISKFYEATNFRKS